MLYEFTQLELSKGEPHQLRDPHTQVGDTLRELERWDRAKRRTEGRKHYYKFTPSDETQ